MPESAYGGVTAGIQSGIAAYQGLQNIAAEPERAAYQKEATIGLQQQNKIGQMKIAEAQREQERLDKRIPLDQLKDMQQKFPNLHAGMYQMAKDMGMVQSVGGKESISVRDMQDLQKQGDATYEMQGKHYEWLSKDLSAQEASLTQQLSEAKDKDKEAISGQLKKVREQQSKVYNIQFKQNQKVSDMAKEYTPESIQKWIQSGDMADLQPLKIAEAAAKPVKLKPGEQQIDPATGKVIAEGTGKSPATKNQQPYVDPKGKTVLVDTSSPDAQKKIDDLGLKPLSEKIANIRITPQAIVPDKETGAYFDKNKKEWFMPSANGPIKLTGEQKRQLGLQTKEETTTSDIKVMQQSAPSVLNFTGKISKEINDAEKGLGPMASRWREFKAGKVGLEDPAFTSLRTNIGLLQTRLMKMHVGARGGEYIMKHFTEMLDVKKQSPANIKAALKEIDEYASEVKQSKIPKLYNPDAGVSGQSERPLPKF